LLCDCFMIVSLLAQTKVIFILIVLELILLA